MNLKNSIAIFKCKVNEKWIVKSGTDFKEFSLIELALDANKKLGVSSIGRYFVDSKIEEDKEMKEIVDDFYSTLNAILYKKNVVYFGVLLTKLICHRAGEI